ncbi:MAG: hypothetical protein IPM36_16420 [Lewinellaceae bacterium]|nr:hypothetical protein [Lewinellaceae bacterium]
MRYRLLLIPLLFFSFESIAQNRHDDVWIMGTLPNDPVNYSGGTLLDFKAQPLKPAFSN